MRTYLVSCLVALAIAVSAVLALNVIQKNVEVAYKTTGVRI